jgi:hypothetical protein
MEDLMTFQFARITQQDRTFMVVIVPKPILKDQRKAEQALQFFQSRFAPLPAVLMTRDDHGVPDSYFGRRDLAPLLVRIPATDLQWHELSLK